MTEGGEQLIGTMGLIPGQNPVQAGEHQCCFGAFQNEVEGTGGDLRKTLGSTKGSLRQLMGIVEQSISGEIKKSILLSKRFSRLGFKQ